MRTQPTERTGRDALAGTSWFALFFGSAAPLIVRALIFALLAFALFGALAHFVIFEHGVHLLAAWPFLLAAFVALAIGPLYQLFHSRLSYRGGKESVDPPNPLNSP